MTIYDYPDVFRQYTMNLQCPAMKLNQIIIDDTIYLPDDWDTTQTTLLSIDARLDALEAAILPTQQGGCLYMAENTTATPIAQIATPYIIQGTSIVDPLSIAFEAVPGCSCLEYTGPGGTFHATGCISAVTTINNVVGFYLATHAAGTPPDPPTDVLEKTEGYTTISAVNKPENCVVQGIIHLHTGDMVYLAVENKLNTNPITVTYFSLIVSPFYTG